METLDLTLFLDNEPRVKAIATMQIKTLHIYSNAFERQKDFYGKRLGLPFEELAADRIAVKIGKSNLIIQRSSHFKPYHIAFHISAEKASEAVTWLRGKGLELLPFKEKPIVDFSSWNAKSIYFYDADQNILEFISRKHLFTNGGKGFSIDDLHQIAEVGLAVKEVRKAYEVLVREAGLAQYDGDLEKFCPIGNDSGLLITVDKNTKTWFPTQDPSQNAPFRLQFLEKEKNYQLHYDGKQLDLSKITS